ncbi:MAG: hypothetical protein ACFE9Z_07980 [Promethearchaeota archaeon]
MILTIEILNKRKRVIGYIEGKKFFNKKKKLIGYLEGGIVKNKQGRIILKIDKHNDIFFGEEHVGFILDSKICFREDPIFEFSKQRREIYSKDGKNHLILKGNHQEIDDLDLFGIAIIYLEKKWWEKVTTVDIRL